MSQALQINAGTVYQTSDQHIGMLNSPITARHGPGLEPPLPTASLPTSLLIRHLRASPRGWASHRSPPGPRPCLPATPRRGCSRSPPRRQAASELPLPAPRWVRWLSTAGGQRQRRRLAVLVRVARTPFAGRRHPGHWRRRIEFRGSLPICHLETGSDLWHDMDMQDHIETFLFGLNDHFLTVKNLLKKGGQYISYQNFCQVTMPSKMESST